jgi:hypothetical protein
MVGAGILYAFFDGDKVAWKCYHDGRIEFFPACDRETAIQTAEHILGVPVEFQETPLTARAALEVGRP